MLEPEGNAQEAMALPATAPESERPSRYKVNATALHALLEAEKPAYVVFTNPAERLAWVIPIEELARAYKQRGSRRLGDGDLDVNVDVERDRIRELNWSVEAYRRERDTESGTLDIDAIEPVVR